MVYYHYVPQRALEGNSRRKSVIQTNGFGGEATARTKDSLSSPTEFRVFRTRLDSCARGEG